MTAAWPASKIAPYPENDDLAHLFGDALARAEMEQGVAVQRRAVASARMRMQMSWWFTYEELEIFRAFVEWEISGGADPFTMSVFTGSAYESLTVQLVKGSGWNRPEPDDGGWRVRCELETDELPVMDDTALTAIVGAAGTGLQPWPSVFPQYVLRDGLELALPDGVVRSDFEQGEVRQTRPFVNQPVSFGFAIPLTGALYDAFRAWRWHRIRKGDAWFAMPVMRGGDYETATVRLLAGSLRATRQGPDWLLHGVVEARELQPAAESVLS